MDWTGWNSIGFGNMFEGNNEKMLRSNIVFVFVFWLYFTLVFSWDANMMFGVDIVVFLICGGCAVYAALLPWSNRKVSSGIRQSCLLDLPIIFMALTFTLLFYLVKHTLLALPAGFHMSWPINIDKRRWTVRWARRRSVDSNSVAFLRNRFAFPNGTLAVMAAWAHCAQIQPWGQCSVWLLIGKSIISTALHRGLETPRSHDPAQLLQHY